jgi:glucan biosynthesis protein C
MSRTSLALSNLRAVVIVIVLAFHSVLAYLASLPAAPYAFNQPPHLWQATPIIDSQRWFGFDLFCAWQDVSLMSLMFFLSGLFVPGSLSRKESWGFLSDRLLRIGLPLAVVVAVVIPIAYYPAYRVTAVDPSVSAFWRHWTALPFWPCGPQWFLCQLLALNLLAAVLYRYAPGVTARLGRLAATARERPLRFVAGLVAASAVAYVPLALIYTPWDWTNAGPVAWQLSRPLHYLVYFFAGYAVGAYGLDRGLLSTDGPLARHWVAWLAAACGGWVLWALPTSLTLDGREAPLIVHAAGAFGYTIACAAGCFFFLAICLRFATRRHWVLDSLSAHAYNMYLNHYVFMVWLQFAVLGFALGAVGKAAIVFCGTFVLSWALAVATGGLSLGAFFTQARSRAAFSLGQEQPAVVKRTTGPERAALPPRNGQQGERISH